MHSSRTRRPVKLRKYGSPPKKPLLCFLGCDVQFDNGMDLQHHMNRRHPGWQEDAIKLLRSRGPISQLRSGVLE